MIFGMMNKATKGRPIVFVHSGPGVSCSFDGEKLEIQHQVQQADFYDHLYCDLCKT